MVETAALAAILQPWVDQWDKDHPPHHHPHALKPYSGRDKLAQGMGYKNLKAARGTIYRILKVKQAWTTFTVADKLLTYAGLIEAWNHLPILPNPVWYEETHRQWRVSEGLEPAACPVAGKGVDMSTPV